MKQYIKTNRILLVLLALPVAVSAALLPFFGVLSGKGQNLVGVDGGAPLVPEADRQAEGLLQIPGKGLRLLRPGPQGRDISPSGEARPRPCFSAVFLYPYKKNQAREIGDRRAGVGVPVVNRHDAHGSPPY